MEIGLPMKSITAIEVKVHKASRIHFHGESFFCGQSMSFPKKICRDIS